MPQNKDTITEWRDVNIFLSSTFSDMQAERDHIRKVVVPRLNESLRPFKVRANITDLRWGVDLASEDEENHEAKVLSVCIDAIKNTRPYFIAILGERYGWIPSPERYARLLQQPDTSELVGKIDVCHGVSVTEMEIIVGALIDNDSLEHSFFCFRGDHSYEDMTDADYAEYVTGTGHNDDGKRPMRALKEKIRRRCAESGEEDRIICYDAKWNAATKSFTSLEDFGDRLYHKLFADISADTPQPESEADSEDEAIQNFISANMGTFVGREETIEAIMRLCDKIWSYKTLSYRERNELYNISGVIVSGEAGSGKSYLYSALCNRFARLDDKVVPFSHVAGLTPTSIDHTSMAKRWRRQLIKLLGQSERSTQSLYSLFNSAMKKGYKPVVLIDSLDSFASDFKIRELVPSRVPTICTALPAVAEKYSLTTHDLPILDLPAYSRDDALSLINAALKRDNKELSDALVNRLLDKKRPDGVFAYTSPLWLVMALTSVMELGAEDFREIYRLERELGKNSVNAYLQKIIDDYPPTPSELFHHIIWLTCSYFNREITLMSLSYMAVSVFGVSEPLLARLIGPLWNELEFNCMCRWLKGLVRRDPQSGKWKFTHRLLIDTINSDATVANVFRNKWVEAIDLEYDNGNIGLDELIEQYVVNSAYTQLYTRLCNGLETKDIVDAMLPMMNSRPEAVVAFATGYIGLYKADSRYSKGLYWLSNFIYKLYDYTALADRDIYTDKLNKLYEFRYDGQAIFLHRRQGIRDFFSDVNDPAKCQWVLQRGLEIFGPAFADDYLLKRIFSSNLLGLAQRAEEAGLDFNDLADSLTAKVDRFIHKVKGGDKALRDIIVSMDFYLRLDRKKLRAEVLDDCQIRLHNAYLRLWPAENVKRAVAEYHKGALELIDSFKPTDKNLVSPLQKYYDLETRQPTSAPDERAVEVTSVALRKNTPGKFKKAVYDFDRTFSPKPIERPKLLLRGYHDSIDLCDVMTYHEGKEATAKNLAAILNENPSVDNYLDEVCYTLKILDGCDRLKLALAAEPYVWQSYEQNPYTESACDILEQLYWAEEAASRSIERFKRRADTLLRFRRAQLDDPTYAPVTGNDFRSFNSQLRFIIDRLSGYELYEDCVELLRAFIDLERRAFPSLKNIESYRELSYTLDDYIGGIRVLIYELGRKIPGLRELEWVKGYEYLTELTVFVGEPDHTLSEIFERLLSKPSCI